MGIEAHTNFIFFIRMCSLGLTASAMILIAIAFLIPSNPMPTTSSMEEKQQEEKDKPKLEGKEKADEVTGPGECEFSLRKIPGLKIVNVDKNGRKCQGEIQVPFCRGFCQTMEYGTHTFPYREQESYFCGLIEQKGTKNVSLEECDDGVEESARFVQISSATECQCQKMP